MIKVVVDLPVDRTVAKFRKIEHQMKFARRYRLVAPGQERTLVEMLVAGAKFDAAVDELRARTPG